MTFGQNRIRMVARLIDRVGVYINNQLASRARGRSGQLTWPPVSGQSGQRGHLAVKIVDDTDGVSVSLRGRPVITALT